MTPREHLIAGALMARHAAAECDRFARTLPDPDYWRREARKCRQRARDYLADARHIPITIEYRRAA